MKRLGKKGFSLIEVMVAMMLVAGIGMAVMEMVNWQTKSARSIASVMDANELRDKIRSIVANSDSCPNLFGSAQGANNPTYEPVSSIPVPTLWEPDGSSRVLLSANQTLNGLKVDIKDIRLSPVPGSTPMPSGLTTKYRVNLVVNMEKSNVQRPGGPVVHSVGGDMLKPITVPLLMKIDNASKHVLECAYDASGGAGSPDCDRGYTKLFDSSGNQSCVRVTCDRGRFPVGTKADGNVQCCTMGQHLAGIVGGDPTCCNDGTYLKPSGRCSAPGESICLDFSGAEHPALSQPSRAHWGGIGGRWIVTKSVGNDGSARCCEHVYSKEESSTEAKAFCAGTRTVEDMYGSSENRNTLQQVQLSGGGSSEYQLYAQGSSEAEISGNCCLDIRAPHPDVAAPPICLAGQRNNSATGLCEFDPYSCSAMSKIADMTNSVCITVTACNLDSRISHGTPAMCQTCEDAHGSMWHYDSTVATRCKRDSSVL